MRAILIVLDSVGIGAAPDAADYGDAGAATLPHTASAVGGLRLPVLHAMGLGNIPALLPDGLPIAGVEAVPAPLASWGAMRERSEGKDTVTGHWEMAGLEMIPGFALFPHGPPSFPEDLIRAFEEATGRKVIGNLAGSGTGLMNEYGREQMESGSWLVYTSADSVFQILAHEDVIPLDELYRACETARTLCDPYRVGRVIARPFIGQPGSFERTGNRRDYAFQPPEPTLLERLHQSGIPVYGIGKIEDIYVHRGFTDSHHTPDNQSSQQALDEFIHRSDHGFFMANFIDFDMLYGHRRDPAGYAGALEQCDAYLGGLLQRLGGDDVLILTADHGNDPTFSGTDHTREYVPLLVYRKGRTGTSLGIRDGFYDVARSLAALFAIPPPPRGVSFLG